MVLFGSSKKTDVEILKRNAISERFEVLEEIGSGGPFFLWRIYRAIERKTNDEVSIFYFDKNTSTKIPSSCQRKNRQTTLQLFKYDVSLLHTFRHARLLSIVEQLKENSDSLAFATEPLLGSLANLLPKHEGYKNEPPRDIKDFRFAEVEVRCGVLQIAEALSYFHNVVHSVHGAISPENIYVTKCGSWKLSGLFFTETFQPNSPNDEKKVKNIKWPVPLCNFPYLPNLDYMAPECLSQAEYSTTADMFSFGLLICTVYNNGKALMDNKYRTKDYSTQLRLVDSQAHGLQGEMGPNLTDAVLKMLSIEPKQRPSAQLFTLIKFFADQAVIVLRQLEDAQNFMDTAQKVQFYCSQLKTTLYLIPEDLWFSRIIPRLVCDMRKSPNMTSAIVRPLIYMLHNASSENLSYLQNVIEEIVHGVKPEHHMVIVALLEDVDVIIQNAGELEDQMIQIVLYSLRHESNNVQDAAVCCLPKLKPFLDGHAITDGVLPSIVAIMQIDVPAYIKCHALETIVQILHLIDESSTAILLDCLTNLNMHDPTVIVATAKLYAAVLTEGSRLRISSAFVANKLIPTFSPYLSSELLKDNQMTRLIQSLQAMVDYIAKARIGRNSRPSVNSSSSEHLLHVPNQQRPQRHSIGGMQLPALTVTSPTAPLPTSASSNQLSTSQPNVIAKCVRKLSGGGVSLMSTRNQLDFSRSQPNSPNQRRHSLQVASRPSSFTNLSHNLEMALEIVEEQSVSSP